MPRRRLSINQCSCNSACCSAQTVCLDTISGGEKPRLVADSFVGEPWLRRYLNEQFWTVGKLRIFRRPAGWFMPAGLRNGSISRSGLTWLRAGTRSHIQQVIAHAMLKFGFLERMMVNHHHFIVIVFRNGEPLRIFIDLVG